MKLSTVIELGMQNALLGIVTPQLRGVCVDVDKQRKLYTFTFYHDGTISEDEKEDLEIAATEAMVVMPSGYMEVTKIIRKDFPELLPTDGKWVYLRKEKKLKKQPYGTENEGNKEKL